MARESWRNAPVAQLDRASASGAEGHRFESCRARQPLKALFPTKRAFFLGLAARRAPRITALRRVRSGQKTPQNARSEHQELAEKSMSAAETSRSSTSSTGSSFAQHQEPVFPLGAVRRVRAHRHRARAHRTATRRAHPHRLRELRQEADREVRSVQQRQRLLAFVVRVVEHGTSTVFADSRASNVSVPLFAVQSSPACALPSKVV